MTALESNALSTEAAVQRLVRDADIEVIPLKSLGDKLGAIPPGSTVTITVSAKLGLERSLDYVQRATQAGYAVVPHLAARQLTGEQELRRFAGRLGELGIEELYLIGGDATPPAGPYDSALQVLEALQGIEHGFTRIGVACYPEGHPKISDQVLLDQLRAKQPYASYMVSQLCFNPQVLATWLRGIRAQGITLPLHIGVAAPMQITRLIELSPQIGVGASVRYLAKQHGFVGNLLRGKAYQPEQLLHHLGDALTSAELNVERVHLFSFNQIEATVAWQQRVGSGAHQAARS